MAEFMQRYGTEELCESAARGRSLARGLCLLAL